MNRRDFLQAIAALGVSVAAPALGSPRCGVGVPPEGVMVRAFFKPDTPAASFFRATSATFIDQAGFVRLASTVGMYVNRSFPPMRSLGPMKIDVDHASISIDAFLSDEGERGLGIFPHGHIERWEVVDEEPFIRELRV